jgi:hypothetical protein
LSPCTSMRTIRGVGVASYRRLGVHQLAFISTPIPTLLNTASRKVTHTFLALCDAWAAHISARKLNAVWQFGIIGIDRILMIWPSLFLSIGDQLLSILRSPMSILRTCRHGLKITQKTHSSRNSASTGRKGTPTVSLCLPCASASASSFWVIYPHMSPSVLLPYLFAVTQRDADGTIELRPVLPDIVDGDTSEWVHKFDRQVTVYGQYCASFKVLVYTGIRTGGDEDCGLADSILSFSFQDIGVFASSSKGTVYYDSAIFYNANFFRSVSDISIESLYNRMVHQYACWQLRHPETPNLPSFVVKQVYYRAFHHFIRCQVSVLGTVWSHEFVPCLVVLFRSSFHPSSFFFSPFVCAVFSPRC